MKLLKKLSIIALVIMLETLFIKAVFLPVGSLFICLFIAIAATLFGHYILLRGIILPLVARAWAFMDP
jgi:hypothetical protein